MRTLTIVLTLAMAAAGCKGDKSADGGDKKAAAEQKLETEAKEYKFGMTIVKGQFPRGWSEGAMGGYTLREEVDGDKLPVASITFDGFGQTGADDAWLRKEMDKRKATALKVFGGKTPELVEDLTELRKGVWSFVTKMESPALDGERYSVSVFHTNADGEGMHVCRAWSRGPRAGLWKALKKVCSELTFGAKS